MKFATNSLAPNMASEGKKENGTRSHVIAVDGSRGSAEAFMFAHKTFPAQDRFVVVCGQERMDLPVDYVPPGALRRREEVVGNIFEKYASFCQRTNRDCEFIKVGFTSVSSLARGICTAAEETNSSSVVVGSRGHTGVKRAVMGSVAGSVVNHCHCPTLVVKPPQQVTPNVPQEEARAAFRRGVAMGASDSVSLSGTVDDEALDQFTVRWQDFTLEKPAFDGLSAEDAFEAGRKFGAMESVSLGEQETTYLEKIIPTPKKQDPQ